MEAELQNQARLKVLEATLISETEKLLKYKQVIDRHDRDRQQRLSSIKNNQQEAKFYRDKIKVDLDEKLAQLKQSATELDLKRKKLRSLEKQLAKYDFEPNEKSLRARIDELKKNRLSLEILDNTVCQ